jgi:hypothetical protein
MWPQMEEFFYEARPYIYGIIALACFTRYDNAILFISGLILGFCSASVFHLRNNYRHEGLVKVQPQQRKKH